MDEYYKGLCAECESLWVVISAQSPTTKQFYRNYSIPISVLTMALADDVADNKDNLFVNFNPFSGRVTRGRGKEADTAAICGVFLDIDVGAEGKYASLDAPASDLPDIMQALSDWGLPAPSAVIKSGNGHHVEWRLDRPFMIQSEADRERAKSFQRGFNAFAIEKAKPLGWKLDQMGDLARVKRALGSFNWKDTRSAAPMPSSVHTDGYSALTAAIVAARVERGLTQAEVASRLARPQSYVSKLERGERRLDLVELIDLSVALGADPVPMVTKVVLAILSVKP